MIKSIGTRYDFSSPLDHSQKTNKLIKRILTVFPKMQVQDPDTDATAFRGKAIATGTLDKLEQPASIDPPNSRNIKVLDGA